MGILSTAGSALKSLAGVVEFAYVAIHDFRGSASSPGADAGRIAQALASGVQNLDARLDMQKTFMVQYNPSELQIYTTSEPVVISDTQADDGEPPKAVTATAMVSKAELNVTLYFDRMLVADSFMLDKPVLPTSFSGATNIALSTVAGESSVQKEVEGFLAALRNPLTRLATFYWSDFSFTGALISVNADYTMFSTLGRPVRARITMRLRRMGSERDLKAWEDDFEKSFSGDKTNLVRPDQVAGNLLNMNLGL